MNVFEFTGDLLDQEVEVIVNAWNRNIIPWWLLIPQGVSGAIKRRGGTEPFRELARHGAMPLGSAVWTGAGRLPFRGIIHVAGINLLWTATKRSIRDSVTNAVSVAVDRGVKSLAMPVIGAGSGRFEEQEAAELIVETAASLDAELDLTLVHFSQSTRMERSSSSCSL